MMFWASVQTMFFSLISAFPYGISKQLFLTDHPWVCMCIISWDGYMSVRAFKRLLWTSESQEFVSPCALWNASRQQLPLNSKAKEQSDPAVVGMDFGPLLFQNWYSTSRALLPSSECVPGALELHSDIFWVFPFHLSRCLAWALFLLHVMLYVSSGQHNVCFNEDVIACHRVAGSSLVELGFGWRPLHNL